MNNPLPSITNTLARLEQLRTLARDLAARARHLEEDLTTRTHRVRYQHEEALRVAREQHDTGRARLETHARERRTFLDRTFHHREQRIQRAAENQRQHTLARIESQAARTTFEIQRAQLEADRQRDADLQTAKADHEAFQARLAEARHLHHQTLQHACLLLTPWPALVRLCTETAPATQPRPAPSLDTFNAELDTRLRELDKTLQKGRRLLLPLFLRYCPWWLGVILTATLPALILFGLLRIHPGTLSPTSWGLWTAALLLWPLLHTVGRSLTRPVALALSRQLAECAAWIEATAQHAETEYQARTTAIQTLHHRTIETLNASWRQLREETRHLQNEAIERIEHQARRAHQTNQRLHALRIQQLETDLAHQLARLDEEFQRQCQTLETATRQQLQRLQDAHREGWEQIRTEWNQTALPLHAQLLEQARTAERAFPPWSDPVWIHWSPPPEFPHAALFAHLSVALPALCGTELTAHGLALPQPHELRLPLLLTLPHEGSLILETAQTGAETAIATLNNLILRLLTAAPPGRIAFTILDPVGLGQNFAGLMHLADYEDRLIHGRIWTQPAQIEDRLAELNEHIEKVTQMYLRNDYATLTEYNQRAGRLAEKYHFLVVAHFPVNFTDLAVKRLLSLATSGPRCGVYLLLHWDLRRPNPPELVPDELRKAARRIVAHQDSFRLADADFEGTRLELESPPPPDLATELLHRIGQNSRDAFRVETPFIDAAPTPDQFWSADATEEIRVPIGRTGATKLQYLALGRGTRQHGLVAGKTGSGKSTLFHVIITNLALWYSPDEVEFYLVDFKKGVEFKCYATHKLPHARVVAIESDREFGLSVLQRVDEELRRRGDLFRKLGVQDLPGYRRLNPPEPLPRILLLIDEFQEFFVEDDRIAQTAALLLDRIVRQGRAFGIHVLLGSQTLGGAYTLARSTMGQMVVRIALQCNEADALLILNEDNPAPRHLTRPGEAIYNDEGGALQGNSPFQVVWLPEDERDHWLRQIRQLAENHPHHGRRFAAREPVVFEGNAPAHIDSNRPLRQLLSAPALQPSTTPRLWLGEPNAIKGPTEITFRRQSGNHLLIIGPRDEPAFTMLALAPIMLAAQLPRHAARFYFFDASPPDAPETRLLQNLLPQLPHPAHLVRPSDTDHTLRALLAEIQQRTENPAPDQPQLFLLVHRIQYHKKLRYDEDAAFALDSDAATEHPGLIFDRLITQGGNLGCHVLLTCDTYANLLRQLSRKAIAEFELRVLFQMSANDSASLIDSPQANRLGLHRALLFHGQEGWIETFRPYALPDPAWFQHALQQLARLHAVPVEGTP
ncbi:ATP-binding protein [Limisphaera ngatamarikiensis]|uniref:ATP-binding protein n=1 Tax=Limisphaera ngatamarikiensis TaxID=1324935 RepID=A0A6M1RTE3_9BACT|nr:ATP-binding protein [Limisphaera ngatamarikiensis]